jgi:hypothetical protein
LSAAQPEKGQLIDALVKDNVVKVSTKNVKLPIWQVAKEKYAFMEFAKAARPTGSIARDRGTLPVDLGAPHLLVDFEGGKFTERVPRVGPVTEESGLEILASRRRRAPPATRGRARSRADSASAHAPRSGRTGAEEQPGDRNRALGPG